MPPAVSPERHGRDPFHDREQLHLRLGSLAELPADLGVGGGGFACLLLLDAGELEVAQLSAALERLLDAGCVHLATWGPDCERVHDIADECLVERRLERGIDVDVPTTWHADEPLEQALWFHLRLATPYEAHAADCRAGLVLSVAQAPALDALVARALGSPESFERDVLRSE